MTGSVWNSFLPLLKSPTRGQFIPESNEHYMVLTIMTTTHLHDCTYTCAYTQGKGLQHEYSYTVKSVSLDHQYTVHVLASQCSHGKECIPHCIQGKCSYICRHMISCTCHDFSHGHLCKHAHKVQSSMHTCKYHVVHIRFGNKLQKLLWTTALDLLVQGVILVQGVMTTSLLVDAKYSVWGCTHK